jgi:hypothetical protein
MFCDDRFRRGVAHEPIHPHTLSASAVRAAVDMLLAQAAWGEVPPAASLGLTRKRTPRPGEELTLGIERLGRHHRPVQDKRDPITPL